MFETIKISKTLGISLSREKGPLSNLVQKLERNETGVAKKQWEQGPGCAIACTAAAFACGIAATGSTSSESGHQTRVEEAAFVTLKIRVLRNLPFYP